MSSLTHAGRSDVGRRRPKNEDRWTADPSLGLFIVADGVGGAGGGAHAAQLVVDSLPVFVRKHIRGVRNLADPRTATRMGDALSAMNQAVRLEAQKLSMPGMGAAVVAALIWDAEALITHVGDSRVYLLHEGQLRQLTKDHSTVQRLLDAGEITAEQAVQYADSGLLTRYVGLQDEIQADTSVVKLSADDRLLLCSDGLPAMLSDVEIAGILGLALPPDQICNLLVDTANLLGGVDNTTAVVIKVSALRPGAARGSSHGAGT